MARKAKGPKPKEAVRIRREISAGGLIWRRSQHATEIDVRVGKAGRQGYLGVAQRAHRKGRRRGRSAMREASEESGLQVSSPQPLGEVSYVYCGARVAKAS